MKFVTNSFCQIEVQKAKGKKVKAVVQLRPVSMSP